VERQRQLLAPSRCGRPPSRSAICGISGSSIVPSTWLWLARICSMRVEPVRHVHDEDRVTRGAASLRALVEEGGREQRARAVHVLLDLGRIVAQYRAAQAIALLVMREEEA
jgi:hypothetical protein